MAQASGYLVLGAHGFRPHAVPDRRRQGAVPHLRRARAPMLAIEAGLEHEGSGYAVTQGDDRGRRASRSATPSCASRPCPSRPASTRRCARGRGRSACCRRRRRDAADVVVTGHRPRLRRRRRRSRRTSPPSTRGAAPRVDATSLRALPRPSRRRRSTGTGRSPRNPTSGRWSPGSASAATRRASRSTAAGAKDDAALKGRMHLIVAAGGGERDYAVDGADPHRPARRRRSRASSSTSG